MLLIYKTLAKFEFLSYALSRLLSYIARLRSPRLLVRILILGLEKALNIEKNLYEYPAVSYQSIADFHARRFRLGIREIDSKATLVSPSDGFITAFGKIENNQLIQAKGISYSAEKLMGKDVVDALLLDEKASFINLYLPVNGYHRWHSPVDGVLKENFSIAGSYLSLDLRALKVVKNVFVRNARLIQLIECDEGKIIISAIGGIFASDIKSPILMGKNLQKTVSKGDELGAFYAGSTLVICFSGSFNLKKFQVGQKLKLGEKIDS